MKIKNFNDFSINKNNLFEEDIQGFDAESTSMLKQMLDEKSDDVRTMKNLVKKGADPKVTDTELGGTLLHHAALLNSVELSDFCLKKGLTVAPLTKKLATPLHWAAGNNSVDVIRFLLDWGADVNVKDSDKQTPLHQASYTNSVDAIKILVSAGADSNAKDKNGKTPIELAMEEKSKGAVKAMSSSIDFSNFEFEGKVYDFSKIIPQT